MWHLRYKTFIFKYSLSLPPPPDFDATKLQSHLNCGQVGSRYSGKETMELLLDTFIHLNSRSDMNIVFTGPFQRKAAIQISGTLDPFWWIYFLKRVSKPRQYKEYTTNKAVTKMPLNISLHKLLHVSWNMDKRNVQSILTNEGEKIPAYFVRI
jgi:hypothetical protein